jgi:hypothetical protein
MVIFVLIFIDILSRTWSGSQWALQLRVRTFKNEIPSFIIHYSAMSLFMQNSTKNAETHIECQGEDGPTVSRAIIMTIFVCKIAQSTTIVQFSRHDTGMV